MKKNNRIIIAAMLISIVFLSSCKQTATPSGTAETSTPSDTVQTGSDDSTDTVEAYNGTENQEDNLMPATREYFENVDKNYGHFDIVEEIGPASHITGSGIIWYTWDLTDGTEADVCFCSDGKINIINIITPEDQPNEELYMRYGND